MQDEGSLDSSSLKAFQNKSLIGCFCMLCSCSLKDEIWSKFSVLNLLGCFLWFHGFLQRHECEQIQDTNYQVFFKGGRCETFKGVNFVVYWWWMQINGVRSKVGAMPTCYCLTFMCCQPVFRTFSVCKVVHHENPFAFSPSAISVMPYSLRNISLDGRILGKSKVIIMAGWVWWRHQRAPFLVLPRAPPTLNPPLQIMHITLIWSASTGSVHCKFGFDLFLIFYVCFFLYTWKLCLFLEHQYQPVSSFLLTAAILVYPYLQLKHCLCTLHQ